ncbi:hypothetical protein ACF08M_38960 [Streptomyces sp. NPDC015032]|uniref:hypothetical protein n=1 Tax=Streptomyces sp. NPDC015032 TaxID=3364937 RepID=UPI0036F9E269
MISSANPLPCKFWMIELSSPSVANLSSQVAPCPHHAPSLGPGPPLVGDLAPNGGGVVFGGDPFVVLEVCLQHPVGDDYVLGICWHAVLAADGRELRQRLLPDLAGLGGGLEQLFLGVALSGSPARRGTYFARGQRASS